jgi:hypothetical protein
MSPLKQSTSVAAQMVSWGTGHWKIAVYGWLALVAVAFSIDTIVGTTLLETPELEWNLGETVLGLASTGGITPVLPMLLFGTLVAFSMDFHLSIPSRIRSTFDRRGAAIGTPEPSCSCAAR